MKLNYLLVIAILGLAPLSAMEKPEEPKQKRLGAVPSLKLCCRAKSKKY